MRKRVAQRVRHSARAKHLAHLLLCEVRIIEVLYVVVGRLGLVLADGGENTVAGEEAVGLAAIHLFQDLLVAGHRHALVEAEQRLRQPGVIRAQELGPTVAEHFKVEAGVEEVVEVDARTAPHAQLKVYEDHVLRPLCRVVLEEQVVHPEVAMVEHLDLLLLRGLAAHQVGSLVLHILSYLASDALVAGPRAHQCVQLLAVARKEAHQQAVVLCKSLRR